MKIKDKIEILLVEDNKGDIRLAKEAIAGSKLENNLSVVENGEDALDYIYKKGSFADAVTPNLILLDLNLPRIDGREVLKKIKSDPAFRKIPVVILSTSNAENDILDSYSNHANSFITKPLNWEQFIAVVQSIEDFWLTIVKLPGKNEEQ